MKKWLLRLLVLLLVLLMTAVTVYHLYFEPKPLPITAADRAAISLMPLPASLRLTGDEFELTENFGLHIDGPDDDIVLQAANRFMTRLAQRTRRLYMEGQNDLRIRFDAATQKVQPVVPDESYNLIITRKGIELKANSGYGIVHGLETLLQLLKPTATGFAWPTAVIRDKPRFPWRGLMIDVCRHWIPKEVILRNLDAMAAVKLNVLHWHLSEYQAFRVESKIFPKLHELGSDGNYYSQDDIREVVDYARLRGIRVIPEFDMPGHTTSFFIGYPELAAAPGPYRLEKGFGVFRPVMNPATDEVYHFIDQFIGEMATLFPDPYLHIGGDEVNFADWDENPQIQQFMKDNNIHDNHDLQAYFNQRVEKILLKHNKKMVGWDEILNPNLSKDIVIQSWRSHKSLFEAVQQGRQAILSAGYYLDHKLPAARHYEADPHIIPGAVTIEPDSNHWQQYSLTISITDNEMKTDMVLYGERDNLRGLFYMMDNATSFEKVTLEGNLLNFSFESAFGKIELKSTLKGDSIAGKMSLGLVGFPFTGVRTGGNDLPGTHPPNVQQMPPLTDADREHILGGEAAMWTEVVSAINIDSRIWPRAAAMAEKWWSPAVLTSDTRDMYRRLSVLSDYLNNLGLTHQTGQQAMISDLAEGKDVQAVATLIDVLEEVKYYERLTEGFTTETPMNEVADAAAPESLTAVRFTYMIDDFLDGIKQQENESAIRSWLVRWRDNHRSFQSVADGNKRLEEVLPLSESLHSLAEAGLLLMDIRSGKTELTDENRKILQRMLDQPVQAKASVMLAVEQPVKKLIQTVVLDAGKFSAKH